MVEAGLITDEQSRAIIQHFKLDRESSRFLVLIGIFGAILISAGILLLISANWEAIPRFVKLAASLVLLVGTHAGGWVLGRSGKHPIVAEGLHLIGSGMFLANIALVGQIYNLSSRPPNAILLWLAGIAVLPWLLRSKAQHILTLCVFGLWLGMELNERDGWLFFDGPRQFMVYVTLGVIFGGLGQWLSRSRFPEFGPSTEQFGILVMHVGSYPLAWKYFYRMHSATPSEWVIASVLTALASVLLLFCAGRLRVTPNAQWRWVWAAAQAGVLALAWMGLTVQLDRSWYDSHRLLGPHSVAIPALFFFCLVQAQVGLSRRCPWLVNSAIVFMGLYIATAYIELFGSMQTTGLMFVVGGVLLIALAIYLERKRRSFLRRMRETPASTPIESAP